MNNKGFKLSLLTLAMTGALSSASVWAQDNAEQNEQQASDKLERIEVTARRTNESLQEVPVAVSAFGEQELERDTQRLREYVEELRELGVEPKGALEGLVDFPAMIDGRLVFLCWKFDESEILYWHDLDGGFSGRQPLTASIGSSDSEPGFLEG